MSQSLRTFIAIELPESIRSELQRRQDALARSTPRGSVRWVPVASIHLTLKFLGEVDRARIPAVTEALGAALTGAPSVELVLAGNGAFPNLARPRVVWAGVQSPGEKLASMVERIELSLPAQGFTRETRAFAPHLTLGRVREGVAVADLHSIGEAIAREPSGPVLRFVAQEVIFFRSELRPEGAVYSRLAEFTLARA